MNKAILSAVRTRKTGLPAFVMARKATATGGINKIFESSGTGWARKSLCRQWMDHIATQSNGTANRNSQSKL